MLLLQCASLELVLNAVCCETLVRLKSGAKREFQVMNLGADRARGADPVPRPAKRRQQLKPVLQPELIELDKSGRNELKCGVFGRLFRSTNSLNS